MPNTQIPMTNEAPMPKSQLGHLSSVIHWALGRERDGSRGHSGHQFEQEVAEGAQVRHTLSLLSLLPPVQFPTTMRRLVGACPASAAPTIAATENAGALNAATPLSILISKQLFQEGEIVELAIRSSSWWILFSSWRTLLGALVIVLAGLTLGEWLPGHRRWYLELGTMLGLARLMWGTVKWMSRIHVLTNMRVMTLSGVFNVTANECPLRRLARTRFVSPLNERLLLLGSLELIPIDEAFPILLWQTIRRPNDVQRKIRAAIDRAQQGSPPSA